MDAGLTANNSSPIRTIESLILRFGLAAIVVIYLLLGVVYNLKTPKWEAPDEPAHFNYVQDLAEGHGIPVLHHEDWNMEYQNLLVNAKFPDELSIASIRYESWQPPLYYALEAPIYEATIGMGLTTQVFALRLLSTLFGALLVIVAYFTVKEIFPRDRWLPMIAAGFIALVPMYGSINASINNDSFANLLLSVIILAVIVLSNPARRRQQKDAPSVQQADAQNEPRNGRLTQWVLGSWWKESLFLGVLLGLGLLTKTTVYLGVIIVGFGALWTAWHLGRKSWPILVLKLAATYLIALVIGGWWFVRNAVIYGNLDIFGKINHDAIVVGQPKAGPFTLSNIKSLAATTFHSFWAQFGWMGIPANDQTYYLIGALCLLAGLGLVLFLVHAFRKKQVFSEFQWKSLCILLVSLLLTFGVLIWYNLTFIQAQGRYLFPAMVPFGTFFALGMSQLAPKRFLPPLYLLVIAVLFVLNLYCIFRMISPAFGT